MWSAPGLCGRGTAEQTQNIWIAFVQCWTNVGDVGPTLCKWYTNVLSLLGGAVVKAACLEIRGLRVRTRSGIQALKKPRPFLKIEYCGEPPWPRGGVLGLRPPGPEFRILCLEGSVISFISPSSGGYPGPVCSQRCCRRGVMRHNILIGVFCIRSRDRAHLNTLLRKKVAICNWYILQAGMMPGYFGCINPSYPPNCLFSSAAAIPISRTSYITF